MQLRQHSAELERHNLRVVAVTFQTGTGPADYRLEMGFPWPLLIDGERELYTAYGMSKAAFQDIWGIRSWWAYLKELALGEFPKKQGGDIYQRGGDILIDPAGIVRLHHVGKGPSDRPSVDSIIRLIC